MGALSTTCDQAIEILRATNDGDDLTPHELLLVQCAVNGGLTEQGQASFARLLQRCRAGYHVGAFHDIEHLSISQQGYVRWKGIHVEHYELRFAYTDAGKAAAHELARRCRILEERAAPVTSQAVIWDWPKDDRSPTDDAGSR